MGSNIRTGREPFEVQHEPQDVEKIEIPILSHTAKPFGISVPKCIYGVSFAQWTCDKDMRKLGIREYSECEGLQNRHPVTCTVEWV
jgi:hypothetical protein